MSCVMVGCDFNPRWFWTKDCVVKILKIVLQLDKPIYHICSGVSNIGDIRLDRSVLDVVINDKRRLCQGFCNVWGDMNNLPFKSSVAGSVIIDPPYDFDFTKTELISELVRILKPKGKMLFIAPWIPAHRNLTVLNTELWKVGKNRSYYKIRSIFVKSEAQLDDF